MKISTLANLLWVSGFSVTVGLLSILLFRRRLKGFPLFTGWIAYQVLQNVALFVVSRVGGRHLYTVVYWVTVAFTYVLLIGLVLEIASDILRPVRWWVREARKGLLICGGLCLVTAALVSLGMSPHEISAVGLWGVRLSVFMEMMTCVIILGLYWITSWLGHLPSRHIFVVTFGVFLMEYSGLINDLCHSVFVHSQHLVTIDYATSFVYLGVLVYWVISFWVPEKEQPPLSPEAFARLISLQNRLKYDLKNVEGPRQ